MQGNHFKSSSIFFLVIDVEVAKIVTSILFFGILVGIVALLLVDVALDVTQVLDFILIIFCNFGDVNPSSWIATLIVSLIVLVFLGDLGLRLTYISKRRIIRLSLIAILILLIPFVFVFLG